MYAPPHFRPGSPEEISAFLGKGRFGTLVTIHEGVPVATHVPFEVVSTNSGKLILEGHLSAANPQSRQLNLSALAIFLGPDTYVSSSWYDHPNVPTWNYCAVHVYGMLEELTGSAMREMMSRQLAHHESGILRPVQLEGLPAGYVDDHLKGIRCFRMTSERIEAAFKLSQNRNENDYSNIIHELDKSADPNAKAVAEAMRKQRPNGKGKSGQP